MKLAMKPGTLAALKKRGVATVGDLRLVNDNTLVELAFKHHNHAPFKP